MNVQRFRNVLNAMSPIRDWYGVLALYIARRFVSRRSDLRIELHPRQLGGIGVSVRSNSSDWSTFVSSFVDEFHVPPFPIAGSRVVVDLGANVGYTVAHFAAMCPQARIVAVEMESENYEMAVRNTSSWADRITIIKAAIWHLDGTAGFVGTASDAYQIQEVKSDPSSENDARVRQITRTLTMETLFASLNLDRVDYLKMDIEGAEKEVLLYGNTGWLEKVVSLHLEVHDKSLFDPLMKVLIGAGFDVARDCKHWSAIVASRPCSSTME